MKNKILIKLVVPSTNEEYEVFIPANERISKVKDLLVKAIKDISDCDLMFDRLYSLIDPETGLIYDSRLTVKETGINNSKIIILL